jgi:hypothetical protein
VIDLAKLQPIIDTIQNESDRACAVLGVATVDVFLEGLLQAAMIADAPAELFKSNGSCATLSSKIDLAFALGLIPSDDRRDLHLLRKIRNDFAHAVDHELSFVHPRVADRVKELAIPKLFAEQPILADQNDTNRFRFEIAVAFLAYTIGDFRRRAIKRPAIPISLRSDRSENDTEPVG